MSKDSSRKLERLLERRRKADVLTISEKINWNKKVDELNMKINGIRIELVVKEWDENIVMDILSLIFKQGNIKLLNVL